MSQLTLCIIIFAAALALYISNIFPMAVTSMLALAALVVTGCIDGSAALNGFANSNAIVIGGMFVVAAGFNRTQFVDKLCAGIVKISGGSFKRAWLGYIVLAALLANFIPSPMAVFAIVFPLCASMCDEFGVSPSKVMFGLAVVCIGCYGILPFSASINSTVQDNGFFATYGLEQYVQKPINFTIARLPMMILIMLWAFFVIPKIGPDQPPVPIAGTGNKKKAEKKPLKPFSEVMGYVIFFGVILLMMFGNKLGIAYWQIALGGAVMMVICGVLTEKEAASAIPISVILIYVGALAMGNALVATGAGDVVGEWLAKATGNTTNNYVLGAFFFIIPYVLTQFMMNSAVLNAFTPICLLTCAALGADPIGPIILVRAASMTAYLTPMSTPTIPMAMGAGGYNVRSLLKQGWLICVVLGVTYVFWVMTVFPAF